MALLPTNIGEKFAARTLKKFYAKAVTPEITNSEYEPMAQAGGTDRVHILSFLNDVTLRNYANATDMTTETWLGDTEDDLLLDQKKYFDIEVPDLDKFEAYVNDLESNLLENAAAILQQTIDSFVLEYASNNYKAGHAIGSDFVRGSCKITAAGALTDDRSDFAAGDVGKGIAFVTGGAEGTTWYRINAFTSATAVTITEWNGSTYSGGAFWEKSARIQAAATKTSTAGNIFADIVTLGAKLTAANVPYEGRWFTFHPDLGGLLRRSTEMISAVSSAYEKVIENGLIGYVSGFKIYESPYIRGDNVSGFYNVGGHKSWLTFAHSFKESRVMRDAARFTDRLQGLNVYGVKTPVIRRKSGVMLHAIV